MSRESNYKEEKNKISTENIQLLTLKPKHHNPVPKKVVSNVPDRLTPDIVWGDSITKCFCYSAIAVIIVIAVIIIHGIVHPDSSQHNNIIHPFKHKFTHNHRHDITRSNSKNPHIVWFVLDDLGQSDFSYHSSEYLTPNIDYLALNGIELKQHYVSPLCSATRSSLLTGRSAYKMGLQGVLMDYIHPATISHVPIKHKTIANHLKSIGYNTRLYGKWHLGYSKQSYTPLGRGFDTQIGYYQYAIDPFTKFNLDRWDKAKDWFVDGVYEETDEYSSSLILDRILNDLDEYDDDTDDPLFMYIAFSNPHFPVLTPDDFNEENMDKCAHIIGTERRSYCFSVQYLDYAIGEIIKSLKLHNLYENTLIGIAADNGPQIMNLCGNPGGHIAAGSAYPLRGGKYTLFQGGVLTPAFLSGSLIDEQYHGTKTNKMITAVDWMPTLLHFTDFYDDESNDLGTIDGIDMFDYIFDEDDDGEQELTMEPRQYLILSMEYDDDIKQYKNTAIIHHDHKLMINNVLLFMNDASCDVRSPKPGATDFTATIVNDATSTPDWMLFDLENDPNEYNDLLNGEGSGYFDDVDSDNEYEIMIKKMFRKLDEERQNTKVLKTQFFESFMTELPPDALNIDGVHRPWQDENEMEFPENYDY